jgi:dTDP-4-dehydrorhamnose reductase
MNALLVGAGGQLGQAVIQTCPREVQLASCARRELDVTDSEAVNQCIYAHRPQVIINAAAYTNVDRAESECDLARSTNAEGARYLAMAARLHCSRLIHISTDFVFDGTASQPYQPDCATHPLNVYGMTKAEGERAVLAAHPNQCVILRTAWLYSHEGVNFVRKILVAMRTRGSVRVVADQIGTPTSAESLALAVWSIVGATEVKGIHHWTDAGVASWYDFAVAIAEEAAERKLLNQPIEVLPISSGEYPTAARRPPFSVLDTTSLRLLGIRPLHWRVQLRSVLDRLASVDVRNSVA